MWIRQSRKIPRPICLSFIPGTVYLIKDNRGSVPILYGDLPALYVTADGKVTLPVLAPRLRVADIKGRSLMIHAGGDNYSDIPAMLGGAARVACGVVK
jgi:Cu/Zn superoxide dismutase